MRNREQDCELLLFVEVSDCYAIPARSAVFYTQKKFKERAEREVRRNFFFFNAYK